MDRLTNTATKEVKLDVTITDVLNKLAEYEDTGLTPRQVKEMDRLYTAKCEELAEMQKSNLSGLELAKIWLEMEKLEEYRQLEEKGGFLKLPCAVGDTVWYIYEKIERQGRKKVTVEYVEKGIVDSIVFGEMMVPQINVYNDENVWGTFDVEDFGEIVFLERAAAEEKFSRN